MIIGISGRIGSGKDTVAAIIQYLVAKKQAGYNNPESEEDLNAYLKNTHYRYSNWKIKKFAGKLKECVSIVTGFSLDKLEDINVKNSDLGDNWERWYNYHYKLRSNINSKGRIDKYVATQLEVERQHDLLSNNMNGHSFTVERLTVRKLLQELGTEVGRAIHPDFWVNALMVDYTSTFSNNPWYDDKGIHDVSEQDELEHSPMYANWIITDMRFPNELQAITSRNGITIRLTRNSDVPATHESETALDDAEFKYVINNDFSTIDELMPLVKDVLIKEKIL